MTQQQSHPIGEQFGGIPLRLPQVAASLDQNEEWCEARIGNQWRRIRLHDYGEIYNVPNLYESLFPRRLKCCSPERVVGLLEEVLSDFTQDMDDLRVLDMGAGNGMVADQLRRSGVKTIYGVDILPEARSAARRDRPRAYNDYFVCDLTESEHADFGQLKAAHLNTLVTVAALGYDDIPTKAFIQACNLIESPGWLAFNIKETFLDEDADQTGFCALVRRLRRQGYIQVQAYRRYRHRLSVTGTPLYYIAMVATKRKPIPMSMLP